MNNAIKRLVKNVKTMEQFINALQQFPHFYLRTDEEKKMTKKDFREYFEKERGGNGYGR